MRRIKHCLNTTLSSIGKRSIQLETLNNMLHAYLPEQLHKQCYVGSFNNGQLVLVARNAAIATELRYRVPELRDMLRRDAGLYQLSSIKLQIQTEHLSTVTNSHTSARSLSPKARETIEAQIDACEYLPLKEALRRLLQ